LLNLKIARPDEPVGRGYWVFAIGYFSIVGGWLLAVAFVLDR
jgi:hypothetical protein